MCIGGREKRFKHHLLYKTAKKKASFTELSANKPRKRSKTLRVVRRKKGKSRIQSGGRTWPGKTGGKQSMYIWVVFPNKTTYI